MQAACLIAKNLACQRGGRRLFSALSLRLVAGEAALVNGANGAGKTSLLRVLAGLLRAEQGCVEWAGTVGLLDDRLALDGAEPLQAALVFWARIDGVAPAALADNLARVGLAGLGDVPVRYLSTGQKKRAALARLLGQRAGHWLLDEPLNGLDVAGVALVEELVAERRAAGGVVVLASHQPMALPGAQVVNV